MRPAGLDTLSPICTLWHPATFKLELMAEAIKSVPHSEPITAKRMTTAEATVAALIAHGIRTVYALPGVHNDHLFDALFKAGDCITHRSHPA